MLHILLLILKIIGIIILVLLGLFLLAVGCVVFVPVRYRAHALYDEKACAQAKLSWLFHLVYLKADLSTESRFHLVVRIAGITFFDNQKPKKPKVKKEKKIKKKSEKKSDTKPEENPDKKSDAKTEEKPGTKPEEKPEAKLDTKQERKPEQLPDHGLTSGEEPISEDTHKSGQEPQAEEPTTVESGQAEEAPEVESGQPVEPLEAEAETGQEPQAEEPPTVENGQATDTQVSESAPAAEDAQKQSDSQNETQKDEHTINEPETQSFAGRFFLKIKNIVNQITEKIKSVIASIKGFFNGLADKKNKLISFLTNIGTKKNGILAILTDEQNRTAFLKVKKLLFRILRHLQPTMLSIRLNFGFDDPATTGYALGLLSLLYPVYTDHIQLYPDFENQVLKGECTARGRLRASVFLFVVCQLIFDKDVRRIIKSFRNI